MEEELYRKFYEIETIHWWFSARLNIVMDLIKHKANLPGKAKVLDIGCGTGAILSKLSEQFEAYGTDTSPLAIELCQRRGLKNAYCCTLATFPLPKLKFDLVTMLDVIEHIDDEAGILHGAFQALRPGGYLLVTVPAYQFLWSNYDELNHHKRRYTRTRLMHVLEENGFTVHTISYFNTLLFPTALFERVAEKIMKVGSDTTLKVPFRSLNLLLRSVFGWERFFLRKITFPFGLSVIALARTPE
jgi:2-polyprenyl-3-methyl-5-hydroxy-6-metoxy-1,4-benzoquinol methylase